MREVSIENGSIASSAQKRIGFLDVFDPKNIAYNVVFFWKIPGSVSTPILEDSVNFLIKRHPSLRTYFSYISGELHQQLKNAFTIQINVIEETELEACMLKFARQTFDLKQLPLFSVSIFKNNEDETIIGFNFHHIICDGWSLEIFFRELSSIYDAFLNGETLELIPVSKTYLEYSNLELEFLTLIEEEALQYWKGYLNNMSLLVLPTDYPRPANQIFEGQREISYLDLSTTSLLKEKAIQSNSSLYLLLLSAFFLVLKQYSQQNDLVVGSPVANRGDVDFQGTIGLFVNSIIIRCNLSEIKIKTFDQLLEIVKQDFLNSLEFQAYPFERVVDNLQPERSLSHNPLFQIMFVLQNSNTKNTLSLNRCKAESLDLKLGVTRFDLECTIWDNLDGLKIRLNYNTGLYNKKTISAMLKMYENILKEMSLHPLHTLNIDDIHLYQLPKQYMSILIGKQHELPNNTALDLLFKRSVKYTKQVSIICGSRHVTFSELEEKSAKIAYYLSQIKPLENSTKQKKIVVIMRPSIEMVLIIIGILRSSCTLIPINPDDPQNRKSAILEAITADLVISDKNLTWDLPFVHGDELIKRASLIQSTPHCLISSVQSDIAYIIHTSGTTGGPKGVEINHRQLLNTLLGAADFIKLSNEDIFASWSSFSFDIFYLELLLPLLFGACVRMVTSEELFTPNLISSILASVSVIHAVPGLMNQLIDTVLLSQPSFTNIKYTLTGGDLVPTLVLDKMKKAFPTALNYVLYGPTETSIICTSHQYNSGNGGRNIIGKPLSNVEINICDTESNILPIGTVGEILIGGEGVSNGYYSQKALNKDKFIIKNGKRFYKTGDKGKFAFDGNIEFHGRDDNQIKLRGFRINLNEISSAISNHPAIENAVTILHKQNAQLENIVSYAVVNWQSSKVSTKEFIENWRELFDNTHKEQKKIDTLDFSGWKSAITGEIFPQRVMSAWLDATIVCILDELPKNVVTTRQLKVLEIGCGTGLILFKLISYCKSYIATDFSNEILEDLRKKIPSTFSNMVSLIQCAADKVIEVTQDKFDLIVINSVCQYFPSGHYLEKVLKDVKNLLLKDGIIFLGDVRAKHLSRYLYEEISEYAVDFGIVQQDEKNAYIKAKEFFDSELLISPAVFSKISKQLFLGCFISPKLDSYISELSAYRYNVIFKSVIDACEVDICWYEWEGIKKYLEAISSIQSQAIGFTKIPNSHMAFHNNNAVSMLELINMAKNKGFEIRASWHNVYNEGEYDLIIYPRKPYLNQIHYLLPIKEEDSESLYTNPCKKMYLRRLEKEILDFLNDTLPRYMVPKQIEFVDSIPLGMNEKVNKKALPSPRLLKMESQYIAPENYLQKDICNSWSNILGISQIGINDNFFKLGGTSLLAIQSVIQLRKRGISLRPQVLFKYQTAKELADFITREQKGSLIKASMISSNRENSIRKTYHAFNANELNLETPLLLGTTGFLGIHLLLAILREEKCKKVYCLIRANNHIDAKERLLSLFQWYFPTEDVSLLNKIIFLTGDIAVPNMGLTDKKWQELTQSITSIFNVAANVSHIGEKEHFARTNIEGVNNIIKLAKSFSQKKIIHISTIGVKGLSSKNPQIFTEMDLDIGQLMTEYYSESKLIAEVLLNEYIKTGGDALIFRVGMIAPSLKTGTFQKNIQSHFFSRYIKATLNLGISPSWNDRYLSITPVDCMASFILEISKKKNEISTFHINSTHRVSYLKIAEWLKKIGYEINILPQKVFAEYLEKIAEDKILSPLLDGLIQLVDTADINHNILCCKLTNKILSQYQLTYPKVNFEWFEKFISYGKILEYFPNQVVNKIDTNVFTQI